MSYEIQEGYPKLHNVAKEDSALAEQYKSKFNEVNADIAGAQALIDDDPTSENYNGDLVLNADKLNAICDSLDDLQPTFINAKETLAEWMMNFSKEVTEYDSIETYNYGEVVTYQDTSEMIQSNAYEIAVPSGAKLATVQKYGGKSLVFNQLVQNGNFASTSGWTTNPPATISVANNKLTVVANGTGAGKGAYRFVNIVAGHKYLQCATVKPSTSEVAFGVQDSRKTYALTANVKTLISEIFTGTSTGSKGLALYFNAALGTDTAEWENAMVIDLTQMFGAGNEPTTVEEVKALLPNDYYEYNTGEVIHADVDKVVEQGRNLLRSTANDERISSGVTFKKLSATVMSAVASTPTTTTAYSLSRDTIQYTQVLKRGTYTIRPHILVGGNYNNRIRAVCNSADNSINFANTYPQSGVAFTLTADTEVAVGLYIDSGFVGYVEVGIMIEKGSTATDYSPYHKVDHPIPQSIRNLDGYGWSAGNVYNEVDFERKKFIKRVGRVDMGTLTWENNGTTSDGSTQFLTRSITDKKVDIFNLLCWRFIIATTFTDGTLCGRNTDAFVIAHTKETSDAQTFKTAMNGVYLYYELATPVETDITDILEPFEVEQGGTLTFHNSNGDGYGIPVPSKIKFGHGINGTFICIDKNVTGAFNPSKWLMLTPSDLGFDLTDAEVIDNNGLVEIYLNDEMIAQVIPNLIYLDDENDAQNGMVYLVRVDGDKYQLRYKDNNGDVNILNNETNANISTYENNSIQTELNRLKEFMERSD